MLKRRLKRLIESIQTGTDWHSVDDAVAANRDAIEWLCRAITPEQLQNGLDQDGVLVDSLPSW